MNLDSLVEMLNSDDYDDVKLGLAFFSQLPLSKHIRFKNKLLKLKGSKWKINYKFGNKEQIYERHINNILSIRFVQTEKGTLIKL